MKVNVGDRKEMDERQRKKAREEAGLEVDEE